MFQQAVSADTIPESAVGIFFLKTAGKLIFGPLSNFKIQQKLS
jgi:hypothetical protein